MVMSFALDDLLVQFVWEKDIFESSELWVSPAHFHFFHEVHFITDGTIDFVACNRTLHLQKGDICIVPPNLLHYPIGENAQLVRVSAFFSLDKKKESSNSGAYAYYQEILNKQQGVILLRMNEEITCYLECLQSCGKSDSFAGKHKAKAFLSLLFLEMADGIAHQQENQTKSMHIGERETDDNFKKMQIDAFIAHNFSQKVTLDDLAKEMCYSKKQTDRLLRKLTSKTFNQLLLSWRMATAKEYIRTSNRTLSDIAEAVGYESYNGFYKAFKAYHGINPEKIREDAGLIDINKTERR